jgi:hypothetical protein
VCHLAEAAHGIQGVDDAEIDKLEQLAATEVTAVNRLALVREVEAASGG